MMDDVLTPDEGVYSSQVTVTTANQQVIDYIEATFNAILYEIRRPSADGKPVVTLNRIVSVKPYYDDDDFARLKWHVEAREVKYHFPGKNRDEAWRFACVGRILSEIYAALRQGVTITKRDIYYHDPALFKSQGTVDRYVDDIAHTCRVTRRDLNVVASPKGLVAGLSTSSADDQTPIIQSICEGTPINATAHIGWILVVEKEAKGYPDLATKQFLRQVLDHATFSTPVFGVFDWDPDGICILKCYLYGSRNLAQEHDCNIPEMRWVGLKAGDTTICQSANELSRQMSKRDRIAAISMLANQEWRDDIGDVLAGLQEALAELRLMLMLNRKAEIQSLDEAQGGLEDWLADKMRVQLELW
ncbi:Meiotic recombination protein rec12 [Cladophialophora carrionii]|uniref:DNA topoisomerase (ATP-hydrolyzing) n=1 Tax=Cladophialophora carrionii TaxID=86049 RepID=A0A1C1CVJ9_9EURO|nr:Meiotic recombination protein rec12 [Cladophialophora carrionii]